MAVSALVRQGTNAAHDHPVLLGGRAVFPSEDQELDVNLDLVARKVLLVAGGGTLRSLVPRGRRFRPLRLRIRDTPAAGILMPW